MKPPKTHTTNIKIMLFRVKENTIYFQNNEKNPGRPKAQYN